MFRRIESEKAGGRRSTGVEELDALLGGGMRAGTLLLLTTGPGVRFHLGLHRIFIAQGLEREEKTIHSSLDEPKLVPPGRQERGAEADDSTKETIAWRYSKMSSTGHTARVSRPARGGFDLRSAHERAEEVAYSGGDPLSLLESLERGGVRISVSSLFSPLWSETEEGARALLARLRRAVKLKSAVCLVSVPAHLLAFPLNFGYFDYVLDLKANEIEGLKYDGLLETLKVDTQKVEKYGVVCTSAGVGIEKIVLPPE